MTYPLRLPRSLKRAVERQSKEDRTSINQFVATAVGEKLSALQTAEFFADRKTRADYSAFPKHPSLKPAPSIRRCMPGLLLPFAHLIVRFGCPVLCRADDCSMRRLGVGVRLRPRGSRSGPGSSVPVHQHLSAPSDPLVGTSRFRRLCDLYAMPSLCGSA
jgi:hypothetical protein